jgi:hypothetical protein
MGAGAPVPVGGIAAGFDQGDIDAELGDLLSQGSAEGLQTPRGGVVGVMVGKELISRSPEQTHR